MQKIIFQKIKKTAILISFSFVFIPCFAQSSSDEIRFGLKQLQTENYEEALQSFTKAIEKDSANVEAYAHRGREYFFKNNYAAALSDYNSALKFNPEHYITLCYKGRLLAAIGKYQEAFKVYGFAIQLEPTSSYAYRLRGLDKFDLADYKAAVSDLYMAMEISPQQPAYTFYYSAVAKIKTGDNVGALKDLKMYRSLKSENINIYELLGDEYVKIKKRNLAIQSYTEALFLSPNDKKLYIKRGTVRKIQGDEKGAKVDFNIVIADLNLSEFIKLR